MSEEISLHDQIANAEARVGHSHSRVIGATDIDGLRRDVRQFIDSAKVSTTARSMALTKLDEMIFWIRSGNLP